MISRALNMRGKKYMMVINSTIESISGAILEC